MEFKIYETLSDETLSDEGLLQAIFELLTLADGEFVPPLSGRSSATQKSLETGESAPDGVGAYFKTISSLPVLLALDDGKLAGFMSFRFDYTCENISGAYIPNAYISTAVVHPDYRGQGIMGEFYQTLIAEYPDRSLFTRTWHTNAAHLRVLTRLGFDEHCRLKDHRGKGIDTVYYRRLP